MMGLEGFVRGPLEDKIALYADVNLDPLYSTLKNKLTVWQKLPLSIVGRVNLIKIIWMPQLLYLFHNAPVWLQNRFFYKMNSLFHSLIWGKGNARIKLETL